MSDAMRNLRAKLTGAVVDKVTAPMGDGPSPMILGLLKSFGLSPETLTQYAEQFKASITGTLAGIDDKLERILASNATIEMKLAELESNQRVILARLNDPNTEQFEQMAEHPLDAPIDDLSHRCINKTPARL